MTTGTPLRTLRYAACRMATGAALLGAVVLSGCKPRGVPPEASRAVPVSRVPRTRPELAGVTIPPNIAPLSFAVEEPGTEYVLRLAAAGAEEHVQSGTSGRFPVPEGVWRRVLAAARGGDIRLEIRVREAAGGWSVYDPLVLHVAEDPVDAYLAYRRIRPVYNLWHEVSIHQRALGTWSENTILESSGIAAGCMNCHTFRNRSPDTMTVGVRSREYGSCTLLVRDGSPTKLNTKWGYTSWHPSARVAAYSLNKVRQFFHSGGDEVRDVVDLDSDLAVYLADDDRVITAPALADPAFLESYPCWSADGTELYFCRAPIPWEDRDRMPPAQYREVRYSLVKVPFDAEACAFGELEVVLDAESAGMSILLPRTSPDGRFLLFCMADYGCFPIYQPSSDLYLLDLRTGEHRRLALNSDRSESWHSWSGNSRWFAFSSKRSDGVFTRIYLAHVNEAGEVGVPFVLPQKDPDYYDGCLQTFSVPEFLAEPVPVGPPALAATIRGNEGVAVTLPAMSMTGGKGDGGGGGTTHPWRPAGPR